MVSKNTPASAYKEETWGKDEEGEYVIDGYKYIGKTAFKKAFDGLKERMIRGAKGERNKINYTVLDNRSNGTGFDIDIQLTLKNKTWSSVSNSSLSKTFALWV